MDISFPLSSPSVLCPLKCPVLCLEFVFFPSCIFPNIDLFWFQGLHSSYLSAGLQIYIVIPDPCICLTNPLLNIFPSNSSKHLKWDRFTSSITLLSFKSRVTLSQSSCNRTSQPFTSTYLVTRSQACSGPHTGGILSIPLLAVPKAAPEQVLVASPLKLSPSPHSPLLVTT